jgi:hypothetical protein
MRHVTIPTRSSGASRTAVWICEYPYRTMRTNGPSVECDGCPVWEDMREAREESQRSADVGGKQLSLLVGA